MNTQLGWTTIEQSKKLVEAELDPDTADMTYEYIGGAYENGETKPLYDLVISTDNRNDKDIPCWSLGKLIDLMPKYLTSRKKHFDLVIIPWLYQVQYINLAINSTEERTYMESRIEKTLIDSVISMIERLLACKSTYLVEVKSGLI